jgi:N utilization substance protein A
VIKVDEDQLSLAIGKRGQNARLTSRLTGWEINIEQDKTAKELVDNKKENAANAFAAALQVTPEDALKLVTAGMNSVEVIATGSEPQDIADVLGIDLERATAIHSAAKVQYEASMAPAE